MEYLGFVVGGVLLVLACDEKRRGFAVRVAAVLAWGVLALGLFIYSMVVDVSGWVWSMLGGLLVGGGAGVLLSVLGWIVRGVGVASKRSGHK